MLLSITGVFKTLLVIVGVMLLFRFISGLVVAKQESDWVNNYNQYQKDIKKERSRISKHAGKTRVSGSKSHRHNKSGESRQKAHHHDNTEDVDFEEV